MTPHRIETTLVGARVRPDHDTNRPSSAVAGRLIGGILILEGLGTYAIWFLSLSGGAFPQGLLHYQDGNFPALHLAAELLMGSMALLAGTALLVRWKSARSLALLAFGGLAYSSINSAGWPIENQPVLLIPMALTLVAAVACVPYLLFGSREE